MLCTKPEKGWASYQILLCDEAEDEAINGSKLIFCIDQIEHGQHPLDE